MIDFTPEELNLLAYLVRLRLNYEARRPTRKAPDGTDYQFKKVLDLQAILEKLELERINR